MRSPPPELADDLQLAAAMPESARALLWSLLGPCLTEPIPERMGRTLDRFAADHGIDGDALARAIRGCRAIVRGAALSDMDEAALAADLETLLGPEPALTRLLSAGYAAAKTQVRGEAVRAAMVQHGSVLEGIDWRLDQVMASSAGGPARFPTVMLTLRYREAGRDRHLTLQATPERLRELQTICQTLLGPLR
jgi:hypothetical protein